MDITSLSPRQCVAWYLVHSFLYYHCDSPVISDVLFDAICEKLKHNWEDAQDHPHSHLLDYESLVAGTGFQLTLADYPKQVKMIAFRIMDGDELFLP